jgi:hypothetical protein
LRLLDENYHLESDIRVIRATVTEATDRREGITIVQTNAKGDAIDQCRTVQKKKAAAAVENTTPGRGQGRHLLIITEDLDVMKVVETGLVRVKGIAEIALGIGDGGNQTITSNIFTLHVLENANQSPGA